MTEDDAITKAVAFRLKLLEDLLEVVQTLQRHGSVGRGKVHQGAETVEIAHPHWLALLEASGRCV